MRLHCSATQPLATIWWGWCSRHQRPAWCPSTAHASMCSSTGSSGPLKGASGPLQAAFRQDACMDIPAMPWCLQRMGTGVVIPMSCSTSRGICNIIVQVTSTDYGQAGAPDCTQSMRHAAAMTRVLPTPQLLPLADARTISMFSSTATAAGDAACKLCTKRPSRSQHNADRRSATMPAADSWPSSQSPLQTQLGIFAKVWCR